MSKRTSVGDDEITICLLGDADRVNEKPTLRNEELALDCRSGRIVLDVRIDTNNAAGVQHVAGSRVGDVQVPRGGNHQPGRIPEKTTGRHQVLAAGSRVDANDGTIAGSRVWVRDDDVPARIDGDPFVHVDEESARGNRPLQPADRVNGQDRTGAPVGIGVRNEDRSSRKQTGITRRARRRLQRRQQRRQSAIFQRLQHGFPDRAFGRPCCLGRFLAAKE